MKLNEFIEAQRFFRQKEPGSRKKSITFKDYMEFYKEMEEFKKFMKEEEKKHEKKEVKKEGMSIVGKTIIITILSPVIGLTYIGLMITIAKEITKLIK